MPLVLSLLTFAVLIGIGWKVACREPDSYGLNSFFFGMAALFAVAGVVVVGLLYGAFVVGSHIHLAFR